MDLALDLKKRKTVQKRTTVNNAGPTFIRWGKCRRWRPLKSHATYTTNYLHRTRKPKLQPPKPRSSADAAIVSAFLSPSPETAEIYPATSHLAPAASAKRRSTMNSRDAAYDDSFAQTVMGPGGVQLRRRLEEKEREREKSRKRSRSADITDIDE
jgi:hypothetical protein